MPDGVRIAFGLAIVGATLAVATRRIRFLIDLLMRGRPDPERFKNMFTRVNAHNVKVLGQKKLLQWTVPGILHALTFYGFLVVQVTLIETIGEVFNPEFQIPIIGDHAWLGFLQDTFFALVILALAGFAIIRMKNSPKKLERRSRFFGSHLGAAWVVLLMIFNVIWTVALVRGARAAIGTLPYADWAWFSKGLGKLMDGYSHDTLRWIEDGAVLTHLAVVFGFLIIVLYSKHMHIFTSPINVMFGRQPIALGALRPLEIDMDNVTEETVFGVGAVEHFSWKNMLDMYTCTECGRCQSVCPAWNTGKGLNPKFIITDSRDHLFEKAEYLLGQSVWDMGATPAVENGEKHPMEKSLVGDVHKPESIWACVTCGACVYECPVDIEHVDQILDMRRYQVMMESDFPQEAGLMLRNIESSGNPWGAPANQRLDWTKGLEEHIVVVNGRIPADAEYLYWVGCAGAFDDRAQKAVRAFAELMIGAEVPFAILGPQESCTGDPARRMGNEYLFQEIAKANIETLKSKGVRKIVASCPHCFNTLAREYPQFGGTFEVLHHSELLRTLIDDGRITPTKELEQRVAYHDPCYLARHNDVIEQPRHIVNSIPGVTAREAHNCKKRTFCCGAGGARMWMEEREGKRINAERFDQMLETEPDVISTGCPYCMIMLDDAKNEAVSQGRARAELKILDVSQVLRASVDGGTQSPTHASAEPSSVE